MTLMTPTTLKSNPGCKSNAEWDQLCAITTRLVPQYGGNRKAAFDEACLQHPELATAAIDPTGGRLRGGSTPQPGTAEAVYASGARPWGEVFGGLGIGTKTALPSPPAREQVSSSGPETGRAKPWREIFAELGIQVRLAR
jgi:hypothetical protein